MTMTATNAQGWQPRGDQIQPSAPVAIKSKDEDPVVAVNATLLWAQLTKPNQMSGKYQVDLCHLSPKAVEKLEGIGIEVRSSEEKGYFITPKSKHPITAFDRDGDEVEELLGNGTKAIAKLSAYDWNFNGKKGRSSTLKRLTITELVPYASDAYDAEMEVF